MKTTNQNAPLPPPVHGNIKVIEAAKRLIENYDPADPLGWCLFCQEWFRHHNPDCEWLNLSNALAALEVTP